MPNILSISLIKMHGFRCMNLNHLVTLFATIQQVLFLSVQSFVLFPSSFWSTSSCDFHFYHSLLSRCFSSLFFKSVLQFFHLLHKCLRTFWSTPFKGRISVLVLPKSATLSIGEYVNTFLTGENDTLFAIVLTNKNDTMTTSFIYFLL